MPTFHSTSTPNRFHDRIDAADFLVNSLRPYLSVVPQEDIVIVGLARGGVIVAAEIARQLNVRLEAMVVRKLGAPDQPELALGAVTASGDIFYNHHLVRDLGLNEADLDLIVKRAEAAARQLAADLGAPVDMPGIAGKTVVLVDDGLATGATMRVAIQSTRRMNAGKIIVALPVAPASALTRFQEFADQVVTVLAPVHLRAVGEWYENFSDVPSNQVRQALAQNPHRSGAVS